MLRAVLAAVTAPPRPRTREVRLGVRARLRRIDPWHVAPVAAAIAFAAVYVIWEPRTVDLAAHTFRADLFGEERARWGSLWFGVGTATLLFTARLPFALGVAFGLAALLALQRRRYGWAIVFAALCPLGSPVAGLFLAMAGVAVALAANGDRRAASDRLGRARADAVLQRYEGLAIAAAAFIPPLFMSWAFPEGGWAPFPFTAYLPIPAFALACLIVLPRGQGALRWGAALYGIGSTVALLMETPMGGNAVRLGALFGGPVLLCALWGRPFMRSWAAPLLAVGFAALAFWQWSPAVRDVIKYLEDPAAKSDYFEPVRQFLYTLPDQRRVEIPFTRSHWEGAEVAMTVPLARGWLRQLDTGLHPIFYKGDINRLTYASWLADNAVRYVALPSAKPDKSSYRERALLEQGLPYLRLRWRSSEWRVYEVLLPTPIVIPQGDSNIVLEQMQSDELLLDVKRPGEAIVKVRWSPYWFASNACVEPDGDWTRVIAEEEGFVRLSTRFAPERLFSRGRRCDDGQ